MTEQQVLQNQTDARASGQRALAAFMSSFPSIAWRPVPSGAIIQAGEEECRQATGKGIIEFGKQADAVYWSAYDSKLQALARALLAGAARH